MIFLLLLLNHVNTQQLEHWAIQRNEEERAADLTEIAYTDAECLAFVDEMSAKSRHFSRRLGRAMRGKPVRIREMTIVLCLVLDHCTLHHSEKVKQYVSNRNMKLENLPRYSPDFDPIELCFSKLRQLLCRLFRESQGNAKRAIGMVLPSITPKDRGGYYGKCGLIDALDHDAEDEDGEMCDGGSCCCMLVDYGRLLGAGR